MADAAPRIWILVTDKAGDAAQMRALARAAGLVADEKRLTFNGLARLPSLLFGASVAGLRETERRALAPPWPDLVLSSGRRSVAVARWIRRQSGGKALLVHVGRPWGRLRWFDLVFAMPQYDLPDRPNVFQARMPFNALAPAAIERGVAIWAPRLVDRPRPFIAVLLGGPARPLAFDADTNFGKQDRTYIAGSQSSILSIGPSDKHQQLTLLTPTGAWQPDLKGSWFPDGFHGTMGELLLAIEEDREPSISAADNLKSLALCFAAVASAELHEAIVPGAIRRLPD